MPSGQRKGTLQCETEITFGGIYSNSSEVEDGKKKNKKGESVKMEGGGGEECNFLRRELVNRLMGGLQWADIHLGGERQRGRDGGNTERHSDGFLTATSLLGPILCHVNRL